MSAQEAGVSSDDDNDKDIEIDDAILEKLASLEAEIEANPNLYESHKTYIALLTNNNLVQKARSAWRAMHSRFPLSEELWFEWLEAELCQVETAGDLLLLCNLYDLAVQDYLSVDIWNQYLQFVVDCGPSLPQTATDVVTQFRELAEKAVTSCGLHLSEGHKIWKTYIEQEQAIEAEISSPAEKTAQENVVRKLYHRALQVPLMEGESLLKMYKAWEAAHDNSTDIPPELVLIGYNNAQEMAGIRLKFEKAVGGINDGCDVGPDVLASFLAYIKLEEVQDNPARVVCVYERAISVFPVTHTLWLQYASYVENKIKSLKTTKDVFRRAQRNCAWIGEVWSRAIRLFDRHSQPVEDVRETYSQALGAGLQGPEDYMSVILAWLDGLRHRKRIMQEDRPGFIPMSTLREEFSKAIDLMEQYFPDYLDLAFRLPAYWAHCEIAYDNNLDKAREIWSKTLQGAARKHCESWLMYAEMEKRLGNVQETTKIYKSAVLSGGLDPPHKASLCNEWVRFEREEGTPTSYKYAAMKQEEALGEVAGAAVVNSGSMTVLTSRKAAKNAPKLSQEEVASLKRNRQGSGQQPAAKVQKIDDAGGTMQTSPESLEQGKREMSDKPKKSKKKRRDEFEDKVYYTDEVTAFVKNLGPYTTDTELLEYFKPCGDVKAIRHMRWPDGRSRGFAYVEFGSDEALQKAILLSGSQLKGMTIVIQKSRPTKGPNQRSQGKQSKVKGGTVEKGQPTGDHTHERTRDEGLQGGGRGRWGRGRGRSRGRGRGDGRGLRINRDDKPLSNEDFRKMLE